MKTVVLEIGEVCHKQHTPDADEGGALRIGRAFTNDIILPDPYIGPVQLEIKNSDDQNYDWRVSNTDTTNPAFLNRKIIKTPEFYLRSGDELTVGRTNIAIYNENHAIPKTREFSVTNWLHTHKLKPLISSAAFILLFAVTMLAGYLETSAKPDWGQMSVAAILVASTVLIWTAGWSLAGYLLKGSTYFFSHLFFVSLCFILSMLVSDIYSYVDYMLSSPVAGTITEWLLTILTWGFIIGFNLALVTYSPKAIRNGMITSACIFGVIGLSAYLYQGEYTNTPAHSVTIKPSYVPTTAPAGIQDYIENYQDLFDSIAPVE